MMSVLRILMRQPAQVDPVGGGGMVEQGSILKGFLRLLLGPYLKPS
jgi:hypothetical protein